MFKVLFAILISCTAMANPVLNLTEKNSVNFRGPVTDASVAEVGAKLLKLRETTKENIFLGVDSPGGSIMAGFDFIEMTKTIPKLHTVSLFAASMASAIVNALPGKRLITESGIHMYHRAAGGFQGQFENGELESRLNFFKSLVKTLLENKNAARMGMSIDEYKAAVKDEYWVAGAEAVQKKSADIVVSIKCSKELIEATETMNIATIFGNINLVFSKCPLFRDPVKVDAEQVKEEYRLQAIGSALQILRSSNV